MKICKNCKHYRKNGSLSFCKLTKHGYVDYVDGKIVTSMDTCDTERASGKCGQEGNNYEEKVSIFSKISRYFNEGLTK